MALLCDPALDPNFLLHLTFTISVFLGSDTLFALGMADTAKKDHGEGGSDDEDCVDVPAGTGVPHGTWICRIVGHLKMCG
jgi:hypothetical protein